MASISGRGNAAMPPSPTSSRRALMFIDMGFLSNEARRLFDDETQVDPAGIGRLIQTRSETVGPFNSSLQKAYIYDGLPQRKAPAGFPDEDKNHWDPNAPTELHRVLETTELVTMRYGRIVGEGKRERQKGVDTRLATDLVKLALTTELQVAHIMTTDTDFEEPIRLISDNGVQVVMYELTGAYGLSRRLKSVADKVVLLDAMSTADLFDVPKYLVAGGRTVGDDEIFDRLTAILEEAGLRRTTRPEAASCLIDFGDPRQYRPFARVIPRLQVAAMGETLHGITLDLIGDSTRSERYTGEGAYGEAKRFAHAIKAAPDLRRTDSTR